MTYSTCLICVKSVPDTAWLSGLLEIFSDILLMLRISLCKIRFAVLAAEEEQVIRGGGMGCRIEGGEAGRTNWAGRKARVAASVVLGIEVRIKRLA